MTFTKITTAGAGTMGSQVAWQMAFHGKQVTVYDAIPAGLEKGQGVPPGVRRALPGAARRHRTEQIDDTFARLTYTTDLPAAVRDADLISESVPESLAIKESFWREASEHAPAHTVFTTNTSTLAPSALVGFVDRPGAFLALHFAIGVWDANIGEVMGHPGTDPDVFERRADLRRGDRPRAHPHPQGAERLHHQQPARALVHRGARPAGPRRERRREHRSNLDDHHAERAWGPAG